MRDRIAQYQAGVSDSPAAVSQNQTRSDGEVLVELKDVSVSYHERKVSISNPLLPAVWYKFLRCYKTQTGQCEQVKGGTFKDQMVLKRFCMNLSLG